MNALPETVKLESVLESLWQKSRFASYFYQGVDLIPDENLPTLALVVYLSRLTLFFNSDFIEKLREDELTGLLVHEMLHIVLNHDHRGNRDGNTYLQNLAQDMIINSYIGDNRKTFFSRKTQYLNDVPELILPAGLPVIPEDFFKETENFDPIWEELYIWLKGLPQEEIKKFRFNNPPESGSGFGLQIKSSIDELAEAINSLDLTYNKAPMEKYTRIKNMDGLMFETDGGDPVPTGVHIMNRKTDLNVAESKLNHFMTFARKDELCREERIFQEVTSLISAPKKTDLTWQEKLKSIVDITAQSNEWEYTTRKFNRRYISQGIYSPGRAFKDREAITVVVDVSGSMVMKPGDIESAFGIIEALLKKFRVYLLCIDETIFVPEKKGNFFVKSERNGRPYEYKKGDWKYIKTGSSGTTYFASLFNSYMENHSELLIVITDGYIYDMDRLKKYRNTLWLISENRDEKFTPPFGRSIKINTTKPERRLRQSGGRG
ncbi:MAG TPA: hypothetical protein P5120_08665 [Spirochaetota bacterium]|nr:hypothetical protein [Spirochaetota bacterium]HPR38163.1 hypothetical protein [Spirochaetota bacterium]HRX47578.1 hypothetical protein [Spirochaetota bacterium]